MRIAVPLCGGGFSKHFGQSTAFWLADVQAGTRAVAAAGELPLPKGGGCGMIPAVLAQAGVNLVIAGGMGAGALANVARAGISAITGVVEGSPQQIVRDYLEGRLSSMGQLCQHHDDHAGRGHGHGCHHK